MNVRFLKNDSGDIKVLFDDSEVEGFKDIKANTVDAALEKHVPVCEVLDGKLNVQVGEVLHPMLDEHYIEWICLVHDDEYEFCYLKPGMEPKASFDYVGTGEVYAFCNLHSLWKKEIK